MTARQTLSGLLNACRPQSLLTCGTLASGLGCDWQQAHPNTSITTLSPDVPDAGFPLAQVHDLALITDTLERLSREDCTLLLGQLRNFGTHQIAVLAADSDNWQFRDFISLGFKRLEHFETQPPLTLYTYNIVNYNQKRDWNNPRYWANPEMWDKARW